MSMWEIEALAEMAVSLVDSADWPLDQKRDMYASIFSMTNQYDVGFTHFRTLDALNDAGFFVRIDLREHPDYAARKAEFESMGETWLQDADGEYEAFYSPDAHDEHPPGIWVDVLMPLWKRAVDSGAITGLAAQPVTVLPPAEALVKLMTLADKTPETYGLLKMLHGFAAMSYEPWKAGDAVLARALELPNLAKALNAQYPKQTWIDQRFDARASLQWIGDSDDKAFVEWWCAPYEQ